MDVITFHGSYMMEWAEWVSPRFGGGARVDVRSPARYSSPGTRRSSAGFGGGKVRGAPPPACMFEERAMREGFPPELASASASQGSEGEDRDLRPAVYSEVRPKHADSAVRVLDHAIHIINATRIYPPAPRTGHRPDDRQPHLPPVRVAGNLARIIHEDS